MADETSSDSSSLFGSLSKLFRAALATFQTRLELVVVELAEEAERLKVVVLLGVAAVVLLHLSLLLATFLIIVFFWETHRFEAIVGCAFVYLGAALAFLFAAWRLIKDKPPFFAASIAELEKDRGFASHFKS
jgi:uncharacterized membrane protein YqjE